MRDVYDSCIVIFIIKFKHGNQHRIFTSFLLSILVEFFKKVFVSTFFSGSIRFVFHFKHDAYNFIFVCIYITKDKIPLASRACVVVFLEMSQRKGCRPNFIKLNFTVFFQCFPNHFRGKFELQVLVTFNLLFFHFN